MATASTMISAARMTSTGMPAVVPRMMRVISAMNAPTMKMSPWAKLIMPMMP